jgi:predicted Zn-dependent protease
MPRSPRYAPALARRMQQKSSRQSGAVVFSRRRALAVIVLGCALPLILAWFARPPFERWLSDRYVLRAEQAFLSEQYDAAQADLVLARRSAERGNASIQSVIDLQEMVVAAQVDPQRVRDMWQRRGSQVQLDRLREAEDATGTVRDLVIRGEQLRLQGYPGFARYSLERAVAQDPKYPEGWHRLSLVYDQLAAIDPSYAARASGARAERDRLASFWLP